jgi:PAS domain-containing protein
MFLKYLAMEETTHFAPATRSTSDQIKKENEFVASLKLFSEIFGSMSGIGAIIDSNRQIIYANNDLLAVFGLEKIDDILGKRIGEVISCIHSEEEPFGCGTSKACAYCGAVNAVLESQITGSKSTKQWERHSGLS